MRGRFNKVVDWFIRALGTPTALAVATITVLIWAITGPLFGFTDTWQLVINTATTIITFLMVFVIQNGQNRDAKAVHIKLDELIRAMEGARNHIVVAEQLTEEEQDREMERLVRVAKRATESPTPEVIADLAEVTDDLEASTTKTDGAKGPRPTASRRTTRTTSSATRGRTAASRSRSARKAN